MTVLGKKWISLPRHGSDTVWIVSWWTK